MSDNPFSEPADNDRTVIRPTPGGRRAIPPRVPDTASAAARRHRPRSRRRCPRSTRPHRRRSASHRWRSPHRRCCNCSSRLRAMRRPPDPQALRERAVQDLRAFERQARDAGIAMELLRPAHYALCASIDDVVLNTPWGAASGWAEPDRWWRPSIMARAARTSSSTSSGRCRRRRTNSCPPSS